MEGLNPLGGRFQARHHFLYNTTLDVKGTAASDLLIWPVMHDKIELLEFGFERMTATGAFTLPAILRLSRIPYLNGTRVNPIIAGAVLTNVASSVIYSKLSVNLDPNAGTGPPAFPVAYRGDVLILELTQQGTGTGAQDIRPWWIYRERPLT